MVKAITCQWTGRHCTVWFEDGTDITRAQEIADTFDGFYPKMLAAFGDPSGVDVDQDGKVAITLTSMYNQYGGYFFIPDLAYQPDDQGGMDMIRV
ncbi:hypothetical protein, partial [Eubacterium aggregans]